MSRTGSQQNFAEHRVLPGRIGRHASARLRDPTDVASVAVDHVVIVRSPGSGLALTGVTENERPADRAHGSPPPLYPRRRVDAKVTLVKGHRVEIVFRDNGPVAPLTCLFSREGGLVLRY